jgi:predicted RNA-binding Zn-ribbon protein involved in translation (DUF1610 family)
MSNCIKNQRVQLSLMEAPKMGHHVVSAPPVLSASSHTIDYVCGKCGVVLLHAERGQVHNVTIKCIECGSYNSTDA